MKLVILGLSFLSVLASAGNLPVDDEIAALRAKAAYLETLKTLLEKNSCTLTVGTNAVALSAAGLRSEGLVVAVGDAFAGNWLAYHKAPKPEMLERVIDGTFFKNGMGKGARILSGQLYSKTGTEYTHFVVYVNEPFRVKESDGLWIYNKSNVALKLGGADGTELNGTHSGKSPNGAAITLECKPR